MYNGKDEFPDEKIFKLSDLFEKPGDLGLLKKPLPLLELVVKVININEGRNDEILNRCKKLWEYSAFIAKAHAFWKELGDLEKGIREAIKFCKSNGILEEFLKKHAREVLSMLYADWNIEDVAAVARQEGHDKGRREGRSEGRKERDQYFINLLEQGLSTEEIKLRLAEGVKE